MHRRVVLLTVLFLCDRLLKNVIWFTPDLPIFGRGFVVPVLNQHVAFSFSIPGFDPYLLIMLVTLIVSALIYFVIVRYRKKHPEFIWWGLIMIGALSNLLDRFQLGGVLDYIDLGWFPVFNLSDVYISTGVICLLVHEVITSQHKKLSFNSKSLSQ